MDRTKAKTQIMKNLKYLLKIVAMIPLFINVAEAWKEVPQKLLKSAADRHEWSREEELLRLAMVANPDAFSGLEKKDMRSLMQATWHFTVNETEHPLLEVSKAPIEHMDFRYDARSAEEIIEIANKHPQPNIRFDFRLRGGSFNHLCENVKFLCEHPNVINRLSLLDFGHNPTPPQAAELIEIIAKVSPRPCLRFYIDPHYLWLPKDVQALSENTNAQKCLKELFIQYFYGPIDISKLTNLETLQLGVENNPNILSGLTNLRSLSFSPRTGIDLKTLVQFNDLKKIELWNFKDQDLKELPTLENLTELELGSLLPSDCGWLSKFPNLETLRVSYLVDCDSLPILEKLRKVYISSKKVTINDIKTLLSKCHSLQEIRLSGSQVTPAEIEAVQSERKAQGLREVIVKSIICFYNIMMF